MPDEPAQSLITVQKQHLACWRSIAHFLVMLPAALGSSLVHGTVLAMSRCRRVTVSASIVQQHRFCDVPMHVQQRASFHLRPDTIMGVDAGADEMMELLGITSSATRSPGNGTGGLLRPGQPAMPCVIASTVA